MSGGSIRKIDCRGLPGLWNSEACEKDLAETLAQHARRPPRGMSLFKFGSRSVVGSFGGGAAVLKYYFPSSQIRSLAYGLRGSRCMRSWEAALAFCRIGIPTPAPLVVAEAHKLGGIMLGSSFLATRPAEGEALGSFIAENGASHPLVSAAADSLRRTFRMMGEHGCVHGDLKANNMFLSPAGVVSFIDLDAASWNLPAADFAKQRAKDRARFLKNWDEDPAASEIFRDCFSLP